MSGQPLDRRVPLVFDVNETLLDLGALAQPLLAGCRAAFLTRQGKVPCPWGPSRSWWWPIWASWRDGQRQRSGLSILASTRFSRTKDSTASGR